MKVWLTQSELTAERLAKQVIANTLIYPVLKSVPLPVMPFEIIEDSCLIITSITALRYWSYTVPKYVIVMGEASAAYAKSLGINPIIAPGDGSESLLAAINMPSNKIIVASAVTRRGYLEQELALKGYDVTSIALYENLPIIENLDYIQDHIQADDVLVVASMQAVELLQPLIRNKVIYWVTLPRLYKILSKQVQGRVLLAPNTKALADVINKCYLEHSKLE